MMLFSAVVVFLLPCFLVQSNKISVIAYISAFQPRAPCSTQRVHRRSLWSRCDCPDSHRRRETSLENKSHIRSFLCWAGVGRGVGIISVSPWYSDWNTKYRFLLSYLRSVRHGWEERPEGRKFPSQSVRFWTGLWGASSASPSLWCRTLPL